MLQLNHSVSLYIPFGEKEGKLASPEDVKQVVTKRMCKMFGGCTEVMGYGSWLDDSGKLVQEPVEILTSSCEHCLDDDESKEFFDLVSFVGVQLNQDCVMYVADGVTYITDEYKHNG